MTRFLIFPILLLSWFARADILFEGYYKLENDRRHVGFAVVRTEVDAKKIRTTRIFIHTIDRDKKSHQSTQVTKETLTHHPMDSDFFELVEGKAERVQTQFQGTSYQSQFQNKSGKQSDKWRLEPNTVLSSSVLPVLLANKPVKGKTYSYRAVQENRPARASQTRSTILALKKCLINFNKKPPRRKMHLSSATIQAPLKTKRRL
jgi:hypothetical protein